jgi:nucleoid DNA-binding protein
MVRRTKVKKTVRTKADIVKMVSGRVRERIDPRKKEISQPEIRVIIDEFVGVCRDIVLNGESLDLRNFVSMCLEDRQPKTVYSSFAGKKVRHNVGPAKSIKVAPSRSFEREVREKYSRTVERIEQDEPETGV